MVGLRTGEDWKPRQITVSRSKRRYQEKLVCQIAGNEAADSLAKKGARILQTHSNDLSYHSVKLNIRKFLTNCRKKK